MKKGGGIGPAKPWQPASNEKVPNPISSRTEKIS
jgi:hypothetical protein